MELSYNEITFNKIILKSKFFILNETPHHLAEFFSVGHEIDGAIVLLFTIELESLALALSKIEHSPNKEASSKKILGVLNAYNPLTNPSRIEDFVETINTCLFPFASRAVEHWSTIPLLSYLNTIHLNDAYYPLSPSHFTISISAFYHDFQTVILEFIGAMHSKRVYVIDIKTKHKWSAHTCKVPPRAGAVVQHMFANSKRSHELLCSDDLNNEWFIEICELLNLDHIKLSELFASKLEGNLLQP
jgi:hypothetical protein